MVILVVQPVLCAHRYIARFSEVISTSLLDVFLMERTTTNHLVRYAQVNVEVTADQGQKEPTQ